MFPGTRRDGPLTARSTLADGHELNGRIVVASGRISPEGLNRPSCSLELEPDGALRTLVDNPALGR